MATLYRKNQKIPTSTVYKGETYNTCFCITETHNVFSSKIKNINKNGYEFKEECTNWELSPLKDCFEDKHRHLLSFPINNNEDNLKFSDDYLSLLGLFISDGTINFRDKEKTIPKAIRLYQTINGKSEFIKLADSLQESFMGSRYIDDRNPNCYIWVFSDSNLASEFYKYSGHISQNKHLPDWIYSLSQRQTNILLKALLLGDGTFSKSRDIYYTSSKTLAYDVATLAKLGGHTCNILGGINGYYYTHDENTKSIISTQSPPMWQVQITKRKINNHFYFDYHSNNRNGNIYNIEQPEHVVCFTVPNGTLVTMFNGKSSVQGNCKQLHHLLRVEDFIERYIAGEKYENCMIPDPQKSILLLETKKGNAFTLDEARVLANRTDAHIDEMVKTYLEKNQTLEVNKDIDLLFEEVLYNIMKNLWRSS